MERTTDKAKRKYCGPYTVERICRPESDETDRVWMEVATYEDKRGALKAKTMLAASNPRHVFRVIDRASNGVTYAHTKKKYKIAIEDVAPDSGKTACSDGRENIDDATPVPE